MQINTLLFARQDDGDCIDCPEPQPCNCSPNQDCIIIVRDCHICSATTCVASPGSEDNGGSGKVPIGIILGPVIGGIALIFCMAGAFLYKRRGARRRERIASKHTSASGTITRFSVFRYFRNGPINGPNGKSGVENSSQGRTGKLCETEMETQLNQHGASFPLPQLPEYDNATVLSSRDANGSLWQGTNASMISRGLPPSYKEF